MKIPHVWKGPVSSGLKFIALIVCITLSGCDFDSLFKDPETEDEVSETTKLSIYLTDAPFPIDLIREAKITVIKVEIRSRNAASDFPAITLMDDTITYDLLALRNGIMAKLSDTELPNGEYDLITLYLDKASIVLDDNSVFVLKVPSGSQSGIKVFIKPQLVLSGNPDGAVLLDFNLEKSFVVKGNQETSAEIKGFNFKPVVHAANVSATGFLEGRVSADAYPVANAEVWIASDTIFNKSYTDSTGFYAIHGIPEGFYSICSTKENFDTVQFNNIQIVAPHRTVQNIVLNPLN